jgi:hypothetical protein
MRTLALPYPRLLLVAAALLASGCSGGGGDAPAPRADVRFVEAALPEDGRAGHPYAVYAKVVADAPKWNVTVVLALAPLGPEEDPAQVDPARIPPGARVWSTVVERMDPGVPVVLHEVPDLPASLEAGRYAAVLQLEAVDFTSADDALQGEEAAQRANNTYVAPLAVTLDRPELPDVQLVRFAPVRYDLELPDGAGDLDEVALLAVDVELESKTHPITAPLELAFELGIPGEGGVTWLPLRVGGPDADGEHTGPLPRYLIAPTEQLLDDGTPVTTTLVPNRERGLHLELFASAEVSAALSALAEPTDCELRAHADAAAAVAEHDEEDNSRSAWIRFFPGGFEEVPVAAAAPPSGGVVVSPGRPMTPAAPGVELENVLDRQWKDGGAGNSSFAMKYWFSTAVTYGSSAPVPIGAGDQVALFDWTGHAVQAAWPGTTATAFQLEATAGGGYRMIIPSTNPAFPGVLTVCRMPGWKAADPYALFATLASTATSPGCTAFQLVDVDGGALESGDAVRWLAPNGNLVTPGLEHYVAAPGTPDDARSLFTIRKVGGDSSTASALRLVAAGSTSVKVFGREHSPLALALTASLDVDAPENNRFLCAVDVLDVTKLDLDPIVATEESGRIVLYAADRALYSVEKSAKRKFLLAGFIPLEVTASAIGTVGLHGEVTAGPDRRLTLGLGPFVEIDGDANAEVNVAVADAGVHMDLTFLKLTEVFQNSLVLTSDGQKRYAFGGELRLQSLDGDVYVYADTAAGCGTLGLSKCHPRKTLIDWRGFRRTYPWPATVGRDL